MPDYKDFPHLKYYVNWQLPEINCKILPLLGVEPQISSISGQNANFSCESEEC